MALARPQVNLYSEDVARGVAFYRALGFEEAFRTPASGTPRHVELRLDGFVLGLASVEAAREDHALPFEPTATGRGAELVLWADDVDASYEELLRDGGRTLSPPHTFLDGALRSAWVADPDGTPIQLVQRLS